MEQRSSERKAVSMEAVVGCPRFGLIRGKIRDLGFGGLYISAETSIVPIGADVTITFHPSDDFDDGPLSIRGKVAHQSLQGFGIEFSGLDAQSQRVLDELLPSMQPVRSKAVPVLRAL